MLSWLAMVRVVWPFAKLFSTSSSRRVRLTLTRGMGAEQISGLLFELLLMWSRTNSPSACSSLLRISIGRTM